MKIIGIIPARYQSTRFPGKPLSIINGKSMIQRVFEQAQKSKLLSKIIVATDDKRIFDHVKSFGGNVMMTSAKHKSGTERCAEVIKKIKNSFDVVINIQGDEPFIHPQQIDLVAKILDATPTPSPKERRTEIATLIKKISSEKDLLNENIVKVVANKNLEAIYFSRHPIPFLRGEKINSWLKKNSYYKHIGIYGYRKKTLLKIVKLKPTPLEITESLEQLRWIESGYKIRTATTTHESIAIDTPKDLKRISQI